MPYKLVPSTDEIRADVAARRIQWRAAEADLARRQDEILKVIGSYADPSTSREHFHNDPYGPLARILAEPLYGRWDRVTSAEEDLVALAKTLLAYADTSTPEQLRAEVKAERTRLRRCNLETQERLPDRVSVFLRYLGEQLHLQLAPEGWSIVEAALIDHLRTLHENPLPCIRQLEEDLGTLVLEAAQELEEQNSALRP